VIDAHFCLFHGTIEFLSIIISDNPSLCCCVFVTSSTPGLCLVLYLRINSCIARARLSLSAAFPHFSSIAFYSATHNSYCLISGIAQSQKYTKRTRTHRKMHLVAVERSLITSHLLDFTVPDNHFGCSSASPSSGGTEARDD
jgi:hypothetical protein